MRPTFYVLAASCLAACAFPQAVLAKETRLLKIDVRVEGEESWKDGGNWEKGTFSGRFYLVTALQADPDLMSMNPIDPQSVQKTLERSAKIQAQVAQARQRQLMAPAKGLSVAPNSMNRGAEEVEEKEIYQNWLTFEGCVGKVMTVRNDVSNGAFADVNGPRPRHREIKVNGGGVRAGLCDTFSMTIVDTEAKKLYLQAFLFPGVETKSVTSDSNLGKATVVGSIDPVPGEVQTWISNNVRGIPLSGTKTETISLRSPIVVLPLKNYSGKAKITMTWSFTDSWSGTAEKLPEN